MRILAISAAAALAGPVSGCAAVPAGGAPQTVIGGSGQPQAYALPMPPPAPGVGWSEYDVVLGFLHASASFAANWTAARQYLAQPLRRTWTPGAVTVVAPPSPGSFATIVTHGASGPDEPTQIAKVTFTGQRLATLTTSGQYLYEPGNPVYSFTLVKLGGVWLINDVPKGVLLLTQADFQDVYQPSNLYFFAPASPAVPQGNLLVPDPVYAPIQDITRTTSASNATLATNLVKGLLRGPGSWLSNNATWTAFPAGTTLIGNQVRISGQTAIVNLGGKALTAGDTTFNFMNEQLQATLTDGAYSPPVAHIVHLEIGGNFTYPHNHGNLIARVGTTPPAPQAPLFFQSGKSSVSQLPPTTASASAESAEPVPVAGPAQLGYSAVTAIAASIGYSPQMLAIAAKAGGGCAVYVGISRGSGRYRQYLLSGTGGECTSLSWDRNGNLWVTSGQRVWLIEPNRAPVQIGLPTGLTAVTTAQKGLRVLALRMAPDGIRAAFLVHVATGNRLLLAAVRTSPRAVSFGPAVTVGTTGLPDATSISWYNAYNLVVLAGPGVYEVPLTGGAGQPRQLATAPYRAQSITTNGTELAVGTAPGRVWAAANSVSGWTTLAKGQAPAYPG